jgi:hypothetical protein
VKVKKELEVVHEWFVLVEGENVIGHLPSTRSGRSNYGKGKLTYGYGPRGRPSFHTIVAI